MLCAKFGWNWPSGSGEEDENGKNFRQTDGRTDKQTDDGQQVIRKAHLSFQLIWAKKKESILIFPSQYDYIKSYPEINEVWITNTPKMAAKVGDKI